MTYAMSDIHGCYEQYMKMLEKIRFCGDDVLYILGDVVDWGPQPVEVLRDMAKRANVIPIMGNHEYYALEMLSKLFVELRNGDFSHLPKNEAETLAWELEEWFKIGGLTTLEGFQGLTQDERVFLLEYMKGFAFYVKLAVGGQKYILTHSGVPDGAAPGTLCFFDPYDFSIASADYKKAFADDVILVTGHRSTCSIDENSRGRIFHTPGHIAIDIGIAYENAPDILGCICLETGEEFYI